MKPEAQQTETHLGLNSLDVNVPAKPVGTMCRGSNVKDKLATAFQLESLILAQNERWRHA